MSDYSDLISNSFGRTNSALPPVVGNIDEDPDKAQRAMDLERATGVPSTAIYGDLDEFERQNKAVLASDIVANNPHLSDFVQSHPMVPKIANDDYGNLDSVSQKVSAMSLPMRALRAPEAIANTLFSGDPLQRFKDGGPLGSWLQDSDLKNHPVASAIAAGLGTPIELFLRGVVGAIETGGDVLAKAGAAAGAPGAGQEVGEMFKAEMMGMTGRGPVEVYDRARPYLENGREPPPTALPEYDTYRAERNVEDVDALKDATTEAQSSALRERNPDLFSQFISQHTDAEIGVSGDAVAALYGDKVPTPDDGLLGWVDGIGDKLALARETGDDVSIPLSDWLAKVDPQVMNALKDDIRVRPGNITANEAKLGAEADTASPPPIPIPEEVPMTRAAAALEPMLSVGDRNLKLERLLPEDKRTVQSMDAPGGSQFGPEQGFHDFSLNDEKGNPVGTINLSEQNSGKHLYIEMVNGINGLGPRDFGPALMKSILRQLKAEFPNAETLSGYRVSGMREKFDTMKEVSIKLDAAKPEDLQALMEGGQWERYSRSIQAYIKPYAERTLEDRKLIDAVNQELGRIVPNKVRIQPAETISADASGIMGQRAGEAIKAGGTYLSYRDAYPIILYALDHDNVLATARHEAIHHLRGYGFFNHDEWSTLEAEALAGNWFKKYNIDARYPTGSPMLKLEESIAEAFQDWSARQDKLGERAAETAQVPSPLDAIFQKMEDFFDALREHIGRLLGKDPTWEDIFKKVNIGEVGAREGTSPLDPRAFNEKLARKRYKGDEGGNVSGDLELALRDAGMERHNASYFANEGLDYKNDLWTTIPLSELSKLDQAKVRKLKQEFKTEISGNNLLVRTRRQYNDLGEYLQTLPENPGGGSRVFERAAALGMTVDQFKRYDELIAKRHAEDIEAATKRAMEERGREQTKQWKDDRKALRAEVSDDIRQRPDVAADLFFGAGELYGKRVPLGSVKLDAKTLTDEQKSALPRNYYGEHGLHPDDVANLFGYGSGGAMLDHLTAYNRAKLTAGGMSAKDFVSRVTDIETDRQMRIKYGVLEDNIMDAVKEQVVGETQLDLLAEETHKLGMDVGQTPLSKDAIVGAVRQEFAKSSLASVDSDRYMAAAGRAGRQAEMALLNNDPAAAFVAKQRQFYATVLAREAAQLEKDLSRFDKLAKRFSKREVASVDQEYTNFIHDILLRVGRPVRRSIQDLETEIQAGEYKGLQSFVEGKQGFYLREVAVADMLYDPGFRKRFEDLTVDEFNAVNTSIKSLVANGRDERKITKAGTEADLAEIRGQMINQLQEFQEKTYDAKGGRWMGPIPPRIAKVLRTYGIAHIQMENLFNRWDHDNPQGVFQQYVMRDLVDAANNESAMEKRYAARLREIEDEADLKGLVDNPLFKVPGTQQLMQLNRGNLRAIMLNVGNASNLDKLARGYNLPKEQVMAWVHQHATAEDWKWAQSMGDIFAQLKHEADLMYRNLSGVAPESIPLSPIQTPHGQFPGWYYPLIAHPEFEGPTKRMMGPDALEQQGFVRATTANGYTKARTGVAYPLALDLDALPPRMKQMIHDIAMRPSVINASKIFYDKDIRSTVFTRFGSEWRDMLVPYLVDVANSANYMPKEQRQFVNASEFIRQNLISTLVGLNPGTVLKHGPTALAQSVHEVGSVPFLKALKSLTSINDRTGDTNWRFAMETSEELQRRHQNYVETLGGATDLLQPSSGYASFRSTIQRLSASPVALSDLLSAVPTWLAQYEKTMGEGASHGDAVYAADRAVRRAHGSVAITNRSSVMRGGALSQWFSSVYGFFNHIMNRQYELLWKSGEALDLAKEGNYREAMQRAPELTSMLFAYVLAPALIEEMVTPLASSGNESWGKKAAKGVAFTLGASWVGVRDVANALLNGRDPSVGLISTAAKTITDFGRDLKKEGPFSKAHAGKVVRDGATLLGALSGVVPAQAGRTAQFGLGVAQGTERPKGPWGWLTGARYGTLKGHPATFAEWQRHHIGGH